MNVYFGLFLSNVNLKRALMCGKWHITGSVRNLIKNLIYVIDELRIFFLDNVEKDNRPENRVNKKLLRLFSNEMEWLYTLENYNISKVLKKYRINKIKDIVLSDWNRYLEKVYNVDEGVPSPSESDRCLASLAENRFYYGHFNTLCNADEFCYKMIKNGTDLGYALTHRLLFLLSARYGRSCSIFSKQEDRYLSEKFCSMSYIEAETIVMHNYGLIDLLLESMCLCALNGHVQFLHQSWLDKIADYQTTAGCFGQTINNRNVLKQEPREWMLNRGSDQDILSGSCNGHVTALAIATYSSAVRLIIENVY
ncbi:unnamed protein product [Colias eurytheme]|nr:unnamed protein product [Colias eurytheme]